jgi:hypothetical protein
MLYIQKSTFLIVKTLTLLKCYEIIYSKGITFIKTQLYIEIRALLAQVCLNNSNKENLNYLNQHRCGRRAFQETCHKECTLINLMTIVKVGKKQNLQEGDRILLSLHKPWSWSLPRMVVDV